MTQAARAMIGGAVACLLAAGCLDPGTTTGGIGAPRADKPPAIPDQPAETPEPEKTAPVAPLPPQEGPSKIAVADAKPAEQPALKPPVDPATSAPPAPGVAPVDPATGLPTAIPVPGGVRLLIKDRVFATDTRSDALRVSYDDLDLLKILNMEPVTTDAATMMPAWLTGLNGKQVIIRGFMRQAFSETGLTEFLMVRDLGLCCFGPNPRIYDMIQVHMAEGSTTDYIELKPFDVIGTFRIEMQAEDDLIYGLYFIDNAQVVRKR